ncbi:MAG: multidrug DMT transporter permease [Bacteroidetes bacterium GWF2_42_66]|nr:MAG: multidrug DMT transporter permease [Bacteroidetes bacterium GWA2_42_15]OFY00089.1 MAG: multidrug DMT transporter permease [Bacteroidetes bacterium GWE2_42_39]OFY40232.1 MAG: multidrug DMT transporter permease [Bacteroidetes bacterium GWF2_42_66]HBL74069.1 multidrug DMT transporter permease [Prolixibacteraceae bacterium]HCU61514.1 multidrug DMT transporter permease [Prolixibacteraceae bacterium]
MIQISSYWIAILFCVFAMICWGSWSNTQKMVQSNWRFELFYWDLIIGILLMSLVSAFTVGSMGDTGRSFVEDLKQADASSIVYAMIGGLLWNLGNLLLVAAIAVAGMSVAFPIGGGLAWILGIILNYINVIMKGGNPSTQPALLWTGVIIIIAAIFLSGKSYSNLSREKKKPSTKGILLSVIAGLFIAFFYPVVVNSLDPAFVSGGKGTLTPYSGVFFFAVGVFISTFFINPVFMRKPVEGAPVKMKEYFSGSLSIHLTGVLGGAIWMLGMIFSYMAVGAANPAIAYALSNAAPVVAILWGVLVWKEFRGAPKGTSALLLIMFIAYIAGLVLITMSNA